MRLAIYGAGGMGRELVEIALECISRKGDKRELVFISDDRSRYDYAGIPVLSFEQLGTDVEVIIAVGSGHVRKRLEQKCIAAGIALTSLVAATHRRGIDVEVGEGAVFCDYTMVTASARIGRQFQCNIYSSVAHDCVIGDYVTFAPKVCCNGNVHIGDGAYIGAGAVLKQGTNDKPLVIGKDAIVGMGAVVTKDVPPGATVVGNPARAR
jgi:sugar O-acyltransferase (sialic acid O-acetyltransferase NeuD family)